MYLSLVSNCDSPCDYHYHPHRHSHQCQCQWESNHRNDQHETERSRKNSWQRRRDGSCCRVYVLSCDLIGRLLPRAVACSRVERDCGPFVALCLVPCPRRSLVLMALPACCLRLVSSAVCRCLSFSTLCVGRVHHCGCGCGCGGWNWVTLNDKENRKETKRRSKKLNRRGKRIGCDKIDFYQI